MGYTPEDWDEIRANFTDSSFLEFELGNLAENAGVKWPIKGKEETPAKYINYSFNGLSIIPAIKEKPELIDTLIDILKDTMAFDDPFGDMVDHVDETSQKNEDIYRSMTKIEIPVEFPIDLVNFTPDTKELCENEKITNLKEFVDLSQHIAQNVVVGGEIRSFLNTFANTDEKGIAEVMPFRVGRRGLYYAEALGLMATDLEKHHLISFSVESFTERQAAKIIERVARVRDYFKEEAAQIEQMLADFESLDRFFHYLENPVVEKKALRCLEFEYEARNGPRKKPGLFSKLAGIFKGKK